MKHKTGKNGSQTFSRDKNTAIKVLVKPKPVPCNLVGEFVDGNKAQRILGLNLILPPAV